MSNNLAHCVWHATSVRLYILGYQLGLLAGIDVQLICKQPQNSSTNAVGHHHTEASIWILNGQWKETTERRIIAYEAHGRVAHIFERLLSSGAVGDRVVSVLTAEYRRHHCHWKQKSPCRRALAQWPWGLATSCVAETNTITATNNCVSANPCSLDIRHLVVQNRREAGTTYHCSTDGW